MGPGWTGAGQAHQEVIRARPGIRRVSVAVKRPSIAERRSDLQPAQEPQPRSDLIMQRPGLTHGGASGSRELSISSTWYLVGTQEDGACILIHTGKAVTEDKALADNRGGG